MFKISNVYKALQIQQEESKHPNLVLNLSSTKFSTKSKSSTKFSTAVYTIWRCLLKIAECKVCDFDRASTLLLPWRSRRDSSDPFNRQHFRHKKWTFDADIGHDQIRSRSPHLVRGDGTHSGAVQRLGRLILERFWCMRDRNLRRYPRGARRVRVQFWKNQYDMPEPWLDHGCCLF